MKRLVLAILTTMLLLLAACGTNNSDSAAKDIAEELKNQPDSQDITVETEETPAETIPEPVQEKPNLLTGMSTVDVKDPSEIPVATGVEEDVVVPAQTRTKMYQFLDTYAKRVNGYEFFIGSDKYSYKNDRFRVILANAPQISNVKFGELSKSVYYYDTIYVDRVSKTAFAYCEGHISTVNRQCAELELYDLAYPLPYLEQNIALPHDWLFQYVEEEPDSLEANKYYVKGRASTTARFNTEPKIDLSIDPTTGLPIRVDTLKGSILVKRIDFEKLSANSVRDADVYHRIKSEIPSSEAFYK
jgi:hypothetical protein